ncbi:MAG: PA2169 family four-helix-bundle protein [Bacteroidota bacterium]
MNLFPKTLEQTLNHLLALNYDAKNGYQEAKDLTDSQLLINTFAFYITQRQEFISQLERYIVKFNGIPQAGGSMKGKMHLSWIKIRDLMTGGSDAAILDECLRGEKAFIEEYENALNLSVLPVQVSLLLQEQKDAVESALYRLQGLENIHR